MNFLHLKVITPKKIVLEEDILSLTVPSADGEITILPRHSNLFTLLIEGIVRIKKKSDENHIAIGGGYLETDGKNISILVSQAYGQNEIDEQITKRAVEEAQKVISQSKDKHQIAQASVLLRKSLIDIKLLKRRKAPRNI